MSAQPPHHCRVIVRAVPSCRAAKCRAVADKKLRAWAKGDECVCEGCRKQVKYPCARVGCSSGAPASQRCSLCKVAKYCSRECQAADFPAHKASCAKKDKAEDKENVDANWERLDEVERMNQLFAAWPS